MPTTNQTALARETQDLTLKLTLNLLNRVAQKEMHNPTQSQQHILADMEKAGYIKLAREASSSNPRGTPCIITPAGAELLREHSVYLGIKYESLGAKINFVNSLFSVEGVDAAGLNAVLQSLESLFGMAESEKPTKPAAKFFYIGQRVLVKGEEIGTVGRPPNGATKQKNRVYVLCTSYGGQGYFFDLDDVEALPNGQY